MTPTGSELLKTLINLYAKQEGVKINYTIETQKKGERRETHK